MSVETISVDCEHLWALHQAGKAKCGNCADWRPDLFDAAGACWSGDRLDGDLSKGPAGYSYAGSTCEAFNPTQALLRALVSSAQVAPEALSDEGAQREQRGAG